MAKIPFTLEAWLKDKSQKIETRNGRPAHYIGLDRAGWQVFEIFSSNGTSEYKTYHDSYLYSGPGESTYDLFIVTPDPELTKFELQLLDWLSSDTCGEIPMEKMKECVKVRASELLDLVKKELVDDMQLQFNEAYYRGRKDGKAEALKDLPRWKKIGRGNNYSSETEFTINGRYLEMNDTLNDVYESPLSALEKLPIFKED